MIKSTVYIDESGDLGVNRGTKWFVLSAVVVDSQDEPDIRKTITRIRSHLNIQEIHIRDRSDFMKRAYICRELAGEKFTYMNVLVDTTKINTEKLSSPLTIYNFCCKLLLERVSWYLRDTGRYADIILSSRGTSRDGELLDYIKNKLLNYHFNEIADGVLWKVSTKASNQWDLLQLADVCATTLFLSYEINSFGFTIPCFVSQLKSHLYTHNGRLLGYGLKYFSQDMQPNVEEILSLNPCTKKERIPGATTT